MANNPSGYGWTIWAWCNVAIGIGFGVAACRGYWLYIIPTVLLTTLGGFIAGGEWICRLWKIPRF